MIGVFGILVGSLIGIGLVAQLWGFTVASFAVLAPSSPSGGNFLTAFLNIIIWVFNVVGSIFQLMTFQVTGLHEVFSVATIFISFLTFYVGFRLVRGGG